MLRRVMLRQFGDAVILGSALCFLTSIPLTCAAVAQSSTEPAVRSGEKLAFERATVRRVPLPAKVDSLFPLGPGDAFSQTGGRFKATDNLLHYLGFAYKLSPEQMTALAHEAPQWVVAVPFKIEAESSRPNVSKDQMRWMMQSLLAGRFHLAIHAEERTFPMYELTVNDPGQARRELRLHANRSNCTTGSSKSGCGSEIVTLDCTSCREIEAKGLSMGQFAAFLTRQTKLGVVVDQTGLSGSYEFRLTWDPTGDARFMPAVSGVRNPEDTGRIGESDSVRFGVVRAPKIADAVREQLGLKLVRSTRQGKFYVIDHVELPD